MTEQDEDSEWEVPADAPKQIKIEVRPGDEYPLALQVLHKEDGIASHAGLTIQQAAVLHQQLGEFLDEIEDVPDVRSRPVETQDSTGREFQ